MKKTILITILTISINYPSFAKTCQSFLQNSRPLQVCLGTGVILNAKIRTGDSFYSLAKELTSNSQKNYSYLKKINNNQQLYPNRYITLPFSLLKPEIQRLSLKQLFPKDRITKNSWKHYVTSVHETWSLISGVLAKDHIGYTKLQSFNKTNSLYLKKGHIIWIPLSWIRKELLPVNSFPQKKQIRLKKPLQLFTDAQQKQFAIYKILPGESIYSSVIIRFTDRLRDQEVRNLANQLLKINGIKDAKTIAIGTKLKIPIDWVSHSFFENKSRERSPKPLESLSQSSNSLYPLHIILDSGHGGNDPGAVAGSKHNHDLIFEDELTYDVLLRLRKFLEKNNFKVYQTLKDVNQKHPRNKLLTVSDKDERLLVSPNYNLSSSNIGINFRVYLINYLYQKLIKQGIPKDNIIFISLHADSLHASVRGITLYYPDASLKVEEFRTLKNIYNKRKEFVSHISFTKKDNSYQEQRSRYFAQNMIKQFKKFNSHIHKNKPIRSYFYRKGKKTLPGVLRYSQVPISILIEIANLQNTQDRHKMLKSSEREKIARYIFESIKSYRSDSSYQVALQ